MLDLRWPIGLMFSLIGALLVLFGAATNSNTAMYAHSLGVNINLIWGVVLLVFGVLMILGAVLGKKRN
jgi:ABC-type Fe3+-siderophore transport system permease subunit